MRRTQLTGLKRGFLAAVALALAWAGPVAAQDYDNPNVGQLPVTSHPQDYKPLGIRAGGFMLHPGVQLAAEYTDNVFYTDENAESGVRDDLIWHV